MNNKIFTEDDYMKFFHDISGGFILNHWYVDYLVKAIEIAPKSNGDHPADWTRSYPSYQDFVKKWETEPCHFYINFRSSGSFNEYIDEYVLLEDIIDRMAKLMQKDYPDLYFVTTEDRLSVFLKQGEKNND